MPGRCTRPATSPRSGVLPGTAAAAAVTTTPITGGRRPAGCMSWPGRDRGAGRRVRRPGAGRAPGAGPQPAPGQRGARAAGVPGAGHRPPQPKEGGMTWPRSWWWSWSPGCAARTRSTPPPSSRRRCRRSAAPLRIRYNARLACTCRPATRRSSAPSGPSTLPRPTSRAPGCGWAAAGRLNWRHIAIDGKTVRGAVRPDGTQPHLLAAYDVTAGTVLGQASVGAKTNEITCFAPSCTPSSTAPAPAARPRRRRRRRRRRCRSRSRSRSRSRAGHRDGRRLHTQAGHVEAMNKLRIGWILDLKTTSRACTPRRRHPWPRSRCCTPPPRPDTAGTRSAPSASPARSPTASPAGSPAPAR